MIKMMDRMKIFLCCCGFINNAISYHDESAATVIVEKRRTIDTKTVHPTPNPIEMQTSKQSDI